MIDVGFLSPSPLNPKNFNPDSFIISFETIHSAKIITSDFINCFFEYAIIGNNSNFNRYKSDSFIYINSKRYTLDKFYKIMIDIKVLK